jgi:hypothetical protein
MGFMKDNPKMSGGTRKHFSFSHLVKLEQCDSLFFHQKVQIFQLSFLIHEECISIPRCCPFSFWWWRRSAESSPNDVRSPEFRQMPTQQQMVSRSRGDNEPITELVTNSNSPVRMVGAFPVSTSRRFSAGMTGRGVDPSHDAVSSTTKSNCLQNLLVSY